MYCANCGAQAGGNFCGACGARLQPAEELVVCEDLLDDWVDEINYEKLLRYAAVRDRLAEAGGRRRQKMTGEELLALFDAVAPSGVSLEKLTTALLPLLDRWGINTGKSAQLSLAAPAGRVVLAVLAACAERGYDIRNVEQMADGCLLTAAVPSTIWSNRGELAVGIHRKGSQAIQVQAAVKITGQLVDWGKSKQVLAELFAAIEQESVQHPPCRRPRRVA